MKIFVTGIGTDVGKTVIAAIVTEALQADYWKPIQAGDLDDGDAHKIERYICNDKTVIHPNSYALNTPMSPHESARLDGVTIDLNQIKTPETANHLVVEGAGGILVPLNDTQTIFDLIAPGDKVIVVSRHYLGSINHTLMTLELLKNKDCDMRLVFNGAEHPSTESIITSMTGVSVLGRLEEEPYIDDKVVSEYAAIFQPQLEAWL